jgi:hypothetical protein
MGTKKKVKAGKTSPDQTCGAICSILGCIVKPYLDCFCSFCPLIASGMSMNFGTD